MEALYKILYTGLKNSSTTTFMEHMALIVCIYYVKQNMIDYLYSFSSDKLCICSEGEKYAVLTNSYLKAPLFKFQA